MSDQYMCSTCNHIGSAFAISCGDWRSCRNFARARAEGTLPNPFPAIGGGPTEADRSRSEHVIVSQVKGSDQVVGITPSGVYPLGEADRKQP